MAGTAPRAIALREMRSERIMLSLAFLDPKLGRASPHGTLPRGISTRRLIDAPFLCTINGERSVCRERLIERKQGLALAPRLKTYA